MEFDRNFNNLDINKKKKETKRLYNTFNELNKKIMLKTQIEKLFLTSSDSISFNPEYKIEIIET